MKYKNIVFDFGNVIGRFDGKAILSEFCQNSNIDYFHVIVLLLQPQKGIKIPSSKILLPLGILICGHTHIQHTPICDCCFLNMSKLIRQKYS